MIYHPRPIDLEVQFLMGHCTPGRLYSADGTIVLGIDWDVDDVRCALHVPLDGTWGLRLLTLEVQGLAFMSFNVHPGEYEYSGAQASPGWIDDPREDWGSVRVTADGVVQLATLYGRPYVRAMQAPEVLRAHWRLVQAEADARHHLVHDAAQLDREWPERRAIVQARHQAHTTL